MQKRLQNKGIGIHSNVKPYLQLKVPSMNEQSEDLKNKLNNFTPYHDQIIKSSSKPVITKQYIRSIKKAVKEADN